MKRTKRKHPGFVVRTVAKSGTIKWDHRRWEPSSDSDISGLTGRKFAFGTYAPDYKTLCLWGTEDEYRAKTLNEAEALHHRDIDLVTEVIDGKRYVLAYWWKPLEVAV